MLQLKNTKSVEITTAFTSQASERPATILQQTRISPTATNPIQIGAASLNLVSMYAST
jgi:hypothetical protein